MAALRVAENEGQTAVRATDGPRTLVGPVQLLIPSLPLLPLPFFLAAVLTGDCKRQGSTQ